MQQVTCISYEALSASQILMHGLLHFISQWEQKGVLLSLYFILGDKITPQNPCHCYVYLIKSGVSKLDQISSDRVSLIEYCKFLFYNA